VATFAPLRGEGTPVSDAPPNTKNKKKIKKIKKLIKNIYNF
jgi:hypothetical protein